MDYRKIVPIVEVGAVLIALYLLLEELKKTLIVFLAIVVIICLIPIVSLIIFFVILNKNGRGKGKKRISAPRKKIR